MMTITIMTITIIATAITIPAIADVRLTTAMLQDTVKDILVLLWLPP